MSHLRAGLAAVTKMRPSRQRDLMEISLRSLLGPTLVAQRGWAYAEVSETLEPAWRLAQSLDHRKAYLPILSALAVHTMSAGALEDSLRWCDQTIASASETGDDALLVVGHRSAAATRFWLGDYAGARRDGDEVHRLYDPERHRQIVQATNSDPFTGEGVYRSQFLWMLGYPEQALAANAAAEAHARRRGHPFDLAFLLTLGAQIFNYLGDWEALLARADEAVRIGEERGISLLGEILAEISRGVAWLQSGRAREAADQLDMSIARLDGDGAWHLDLVFAYDSGSGARRDRAYGRGAGDDGREPGANGGGTGTRPLRRGAAASWMARAPAGRGRESGGLFPSRHCGGARPAGEILGVARGDLAGDAAWRTGAPRPKRRRCCRPPTIRFEEGFDTHDLKAARQALAALG